MSRKLAVWSTTGSGTAVSENTDTPHKGYQSFVDRYGRDACVSVNVGDGNSYKLCRISALVVDAGSIQVGDALRET